MKTLSKVLLTITILGILQPAFSQITISNTTFPAAGDTLKTATDGTPDGVTITGPGGPYTWDFSMLKADSRFETVFQSANVGMAFASYPNAELVVIGDAGGETYYDVSATAFSNLGISGSDILGGFMLDADLKFLPPLQERLAPLSYPSVNNTSSSLAIAFSTASLPDGILDSLGIPSGLLDSIRVKLTIQRAEFVDAFGSLTIPGGTYEVLRQKRTDISNLRLEIHTFLGWQDVTDLVPLDGFGQDTTILYQFLNDIEKEPIAEVTMDSTGMNAVLVDYKDNGIINAVIEIPNALLDLMVYPNPANDVVTISFKPAVSAIYTLRMYDSTGKILTSKDVSTGMEQLSLSSFSTGIYMYKIQNESGQVAAVGRLIKI